MAEVRIDTEEDTTRGWAYRLTVCHDDGRESDHAVSLSWVDHDYWSGGRTAPSRTIEAVVRYLIENGSSLSLPPIFDAARARRWFPQIDEELRFAV